ncbi:MAG: C25 family cysteine peptidase [Chloroflexota bacterium]
MIDRLNIFIRGRVSARLLGILAVSSLISAYLNGCSPSGNVVGSDLPPSEGVKLMIPTTGIYEVSSQALRAVWGKQIEPGTLQLTYEGGPQPIWLVRDGSEWRLRFYAQATDSEYTADNVYWLSEGETPWLLINEVPHGVGEAGSELIHQYTATIHQEENLRFLPKVESGDHWLWLAMTAPQGETFTLKLDALAPGGGYLRVGLWGSTEAEDSEADHHLRASLNGQLVAEARWDGVGRYVLEGEVPPGLLREGENEISLEAPGDTGVLVDTVVLDWIELDYPRFLVPGEGQLSFEGFDGMIGLVGFPEGVDVFERLPTGEMNHFTSLYQSGDSFYFMGHSGRHYTVVPNGAYLQPSAMHPASLLPDLRALEGADYLVIAPQDFLPYVEPLLEYRRQQGLAALSIPVEAVYDQFNFGLPEPQAIQAFLRYAAAQWNPSPRYLLLVGDTTYDVHGYQVSTDWNRMPTFWMDTIFGGVTASDIFYALVDDDPRPDIAVGRFPVQTTEQLQRMIAKTLAYEQDPPQGEWQSLVLGVADGDAPSFEGDAQAFLAHFSSPYKTRLFVPEAGEQGVNQKVIEFINKGVFLIAYFGHGSVTQWGKGGIFYAQDVGQLANSHLPIIVNMTCLTGLFTHPQVDSLAETLLWKADGGAVAVLAPTSLTLPQDQNVLSDALAQAWLADAPSRLGEILLHAWNQVPLEDETVREVLYTFLLFGDPALVIPAP